MLDITSLFKYKNIKRPSQPQYKRPKHHHSTLNQNATLLFERLTTPYPIELYLQQVPHDLHTYSVHSQIYRFILAQSITIHNAFVLITHYQCLHIDHHNYLTIIESLCQITPMNISELNCIIHFIIKKINQPFNFTKMHNFNSLYCNLDSIDQKISCVELFIEIIKTNYGINNIKWVNSLFLTAFAHFKKTMEEILSGSVINVQRSIIKQRIMDKAIQMQEVEGFISPKNLFQYAWNAYKLSSILSLKSMIIYKTEKSQWIYELMEGVVFYSGDLTQNDIICLADIIIKTGQYTEQLNEKSFLAEFVQGMITAHSGSIFRNHNLATAISLCPLSPNPRYQYPLVEFSESQSIICLLLKQVYGLKLQYLHCFEIILRYTRWYRQSQQFIKLQFYLLKNQFLHFLLEDCKGGTNMSCYYDCISYMLKQNHLINSVFNLILDQDGVQRNLIKSIKKNTFLARSMLISMLSDSYQITIKNLYQQQFTNCLLDGIFKNKQSIWTTFIISYQTNKQQQVIEWITMFLIMHLVYGEENFLDGIFEQQMEHLMKQKLNKWQDYYNQNLKNKLNQHGLSYKDLKHAKTKTLVQIDQYLFKKTSH